jgi:tetratricopeptide (TPR) repeat protein
MVTLTAEIMRQISTASQVDHPLDLLSLAKWQAALGMGEAAEINYRLAAEGDLSLEQYHQALKHLGLLLKRNNRRTEAVPLWQQWAATSLDDVEAHIELAMYFEWHEKDLDKAKMWTEQALSLVDHWSARKATIQRPALEHRLDRLRRKLASKDS